MKAKTIIVGIVLLTACGAALADPISLIATVAANVFADYAIAIYIAGPCIGNAIARTRSQRKAVQP